MKDRTPIIFDVFSAAGGATALANRMGLSRAAVYKWKKVPIRHLKYISTLTGISKQKLRPDLYDD